MSKPSINRLSLVLIIVGQVALTTNGADGPALLLPEPAVQNLATQENQSDKDNPQNPGSSVVPPPAEIPQGENETSEGSGKSDPETSDSKTTDLDKNETGASESEPQTDTKPANEAEPTNSASESEANASPESDPPAEMPVAAEDETESGTTKTKTTAPALSAPDPPSDGKPESGANSVEESAAEKTKTNSVEAAANKPVQPQEKSTTPGNDSDAPAKTEQPANAEKKTESTGAETQTKPPRPDRLQHPYLEETTLQERRKTLPGDAMDLEEFDEQSPTTADDKTNSQTPVNSSEPASAADEADNPSTQQQLLKTPRSSNKPVVDWDPNSDAPIWNWDTADTDAPLWSAQSDSNLVNETKSAPANDPAPPAPDDSNDDGTAQPANRFSILNSSNSTDSRETRKPIKPAADSSKFEVIQPPSDSSDTSNLAEEVIVQQRYKIPSPDVKFTPDEKKNVNPQPTRRIRHHGVFRPTTDGKPFYNLHVLTTESFANRQLARNDTQTGPVADIVLGAQVRGQHRTETQLSVDFKPSLGKARVDLFLNGKTRSETTGTLPEATVETLGQHTFRLHKPTWFDGYRFTTTSPGVRINTNNTPRGVRTTYSNLPLIGQYAQNVAWQQVRKNRTQTEQISAQKLSQRVVPQFNQQIDRELAGINKRIKNNYLLALEQYRIKPDDIFVATSEEYLRLSAGVRTPLPILQTEPPASRPHGTALSVYVHESMIGSLIQRMGTNGLAVPDQRLKQLLSMLKGAENQSSDFNPLSTTASPELYTLTINNNRPVWLEVENGQILLNLQFGIRPKVGSELPEQHVVIPLDLQVQGDSISVTPGAMTIEPADESSSGITDSIVTNLLKQRLKQQLVPTQIPALFNLPGSNPTRLRVREIKMELGWLMLAIDA